MTTKLYWRPRAVSRNVLIMICVISLLGVAVVRHWKVRVQQRYFDLKIQAAELAQECMLRIKFERILLPEPMDPELDPTESGLIGEAMTPVTSVPGVLAAKQTTINPNFAAVIVEMLLDAGVKRGDVVAIGLSASFPALNICTLAACETLELKPIVVSSASASQFGANRPDLLWIDMERILNENELLNVRSAAVSLGGQEDRGQGMSEQGVKLLKDAIRRNKLRFIDSQNYEQGLEQRMQIYRDEAENRPIAAYINVGGGAISVGRTAGKHSLREGLNRWAPREALAIDSVMSRFLSQSTPVIHMVNVVNLAERYGLPLQPLEAPRIGEGNIYYRDEASPMLAAGMLVLIFLSLYAFVLSDLGFRVFYFSSSKKDAGHPEPMF